MIAITYIGHATTLIEIDGINILTDPLFAKRVLLLKRSEEMRFDPGKLPELSAVLITHAHHDHLDINSFKYIKSSVPVFVPHGLGGFLGRFIRNPVIEMKNWSGHRLTNGTEITATHAQHVGFRWIPVRFRHANGYVISTPNASVFFAGDTAYGPHFKDVARVFGEKRPVDVALIPIGGYLPRWFMRGRHLDPGEAIEAFLDTGAKHMVPIHFGAFRLSAEKLEEPVELLSRIAIERELGDRIHLLRSGETFTVEESLRTTPLP